MLNRRYLRIKVFLALYAFWQSDAASAAKIEKELFLSIERTRDLYVSLLELFGAVHRAALSRIEDRMVKRLPTADDLNPNRRFVDNPVLLAIVNSPLVAAEAARRKVNWVGHGELVGRIYKQLESSEEFMAYMADPEPSYKKDQALVLRLFVEHMANHEPIHDHFEGRSIHWLEDLDLASTMVKRTIEAIKEEGNAEEAFGELLRETAEESAFVSNLFRRTIQQGEEHEGMIAEKASNWETDRIALTDMILMKMALTEARVFLEIPVKVSLNEYIEIAKAYSTPKSKNFINGILDKIFAEMRENGAIRKVGRGLLES